MRTTIFFYNNVLGAETDIENGKFLNNPKEGGQLGVVVPVEEIDITPAAVEALKNARREGGSFAPIMLTLHEDQSESKASIGLFGAGKHAFFGEDICIGRTCDTSVLDLCNITEFEPPTGFKEFVDTL